MKVLKGGCTFLKKGGISRRGDEKSWKESKIISNLAFSSVASSVVSTSKTITTKFDIFTPYYMSLFGSEVKTTFSDFYQLKTS